MSSNLDYIEYIMEQIRTVGETRYRKMFGEYMIYVNDKPLLLVCNDIVHVKILPELAELMANADTNTPYEGAKTHYILDVDDSEMACEVLSILDSITKVPVKRLKPTKSK